jgi:hypothetical protein
VRRVFDEDARRLHLLNDARELSPKTGSLAIEPGARSGAADVLAGESSADDIDFSIPRLAVERPNVVPNREAMENAVALPGEQYRTAIGIELDSADGAPAKEQPSQDASSSSCK